MYSKKSRNKPLYKKFVSLRKNVQNRKKLLNFKKRKWQNLIAHSKRLLKRRKKNFKLYDQNKYFIFKFNNSFKRKYKYTLETKKKFSLFYGNLLKKCLKRQVKFVLKKQKFFQKNSTNLNSYFIELFEKRLDTILYRAHFTLSFRNAQQLILHRHVYVNNQIVTNSSYVLKNGDLVELDLKIHHLINNYISNSNLWPIPGKYLQINYKTLQIVFIGDIKSFNTSLSFPFWLDVKTIIKSFY